MVVAGEVQQSSRPFGSPALSPDTPICDDLCDAQKVGESAILSVLLRFELNHLVRWNVFTVPLLGYIRSINTSTANTTSIKFFCSSVRASMWKSFRSASQTYHVDALCSARDLSYTSDASLRTWTPARCVLSLQNHQRFLKISLMEVLGTGEGMIVALTQRPCSWSIMTRKRDDSHDAGIPCYTKSSGSWNHCNLSECTLGSTFLCTVGTHSVSA